MSFSTLCNKQVASVTFCCLFGWMLDVFVLTDVPSLFISWLLRFAGVLWAVFTFCSGDQVLERCFFCFLFTASISFVKPLVCLYGENRLQIVQSWTAAAVNDAMRNGKRKHNTKTFLIREAPPLIMATPPHCSSPIVAPPPPPLPDR